MNRLKFRSKSAPCTVHLTGENENDHAPSGLNVDLSGRGPILRHSTQEHKLHAEEHYTKCIDSRRDATRRHNSVYWCTDSTCVFSHCLFGFCHLLIFDWKFVKICSRPPHKCVQMDRNVHMFGDFVMIFDDCGHVTENLWGSQICGKMAKTVIFRRFMKFHSWNLDLWCQEIFLRNLKLFCNRSLVTPRRAGCDFSKKPKIKKHRFYVRIWHKSLVI